MNDLIGATSGEWDIPIIETQTVASHMLLRRLLVACPTTGGPVDTGFELFAVPSVGEGSHRLMECLECGQDHSWAIEDAFLN